MSDDIRSLIRAAQEAEGRREPLVAAGHLQRAAERLERSGRPARAVQLLRHAVRLSGDVGQQRHLEALERTLVAAGPAVPERQGQVFELDEEDADGALPFRPPPGTPGALNPQAPGGAGEIAAPVPGPSSSGARALEVLRSPDVRGPDGSGDVRPEASEPSPRTYRSDAGVGGLLLAHHVPVLGQVEVALAEGTRVVLLLGPQGSGRSTCLSALAARLGGVIVGPPFAAIPPTELLLLDDAHRLVPAAWAELERTLRARPTMRVVLAAPRAAEVTAVPALIATTGAGEVPLWTTAGILEVSPGLPPSLAGRVERVVEVALPLPAQLERLVRELLSTHRPELRDSGAVAEILVAHTLRSPRGLHELISLVHRLPVDVRSVRAYPLTEDAPKRAVSKRGSSKALASKAGGTKRATSKRVFSKGSSSEASASKADEASSATSKRASTNAVASATNAGGTRTASKRSSTKAVTSASKAEGARPTSKRASTKASASASKTEGARPTSKRASSKAVASATKAAGTKRPTSKRASAKAAASSSKVETSTRASSKPASTKAAPPSREARTTNTRQNPLKAAGLTGPKQTKG